MCFGPYLDLMPQPAEGRAGPARYGKSITFRLRLTAPERPTGDIVDYVCREIEWVRGQLV